jgi:hypothetical protein
VIKLPVCGELLLHKDAQPHPDLGRDDLGAFRVWVAAEALKMRGQE